MEEQTLTWDEYVQAASSIIEVRENYQRTLGKLSSDLVNKYGKSALQGFSEEIKETHGLSISPATLRNYRWVWDKTAHLSLPEDLSYRTLQYIASSDNPEYWAMRILDEGLSSAEVYRLIRKEKGLDKKKKETYICKDCGCENEV